MRSRSPSRRRARRSQPAVDKLGRLIGREEQRKLSSAPLADWRAHQGAIQGREAWATFGEWIDRHNPRFGFEVADNILRGARIEDAAVEAATRSALRGGPSSINCSTMRRSSAFPPTPFPAPLRGLPRSLIWEKRVPVSTLTTIAGTLGTPQLSMPLGQVDGLPVGLSIMGKRGSDDVLLAVAFELARG